METKKCIRHFSDLISNNKNESTKLELVDDNNLFNSLYPVETLKSYDKLMKGFSAQYLKNILELQTLAKVESERKFKINLYRLIVGLILGFLYKDFLTFLRTIF